MIKSYHLMSKLDAFVMVMMKEDTGFDFVHGRVLNFLCTLENEGRKRAIPRGALRTITPSVTAAFVSERSKPSVPYQVDFRVCCEAASLTESMEKYFQGAYEASKKSNLAVIQ